MVGMKLVPLPLLVGLLSLGPLSAATAGAAEPTAAQGATPTAVKGAAPVTAQAAASAGAPGATPAAPAQAAQAASAPAGAVLGVPGPDVAGREPIEPNVQHIVVEGENTRIEELRVRGQTQSVTVRNKNAPSYEIVIGDGSRDMSNDGSAQRGAAGQRVWRLLSF